MIRPAEFAELSAFVAVAEARSFRRAADTLKLRPSTLSHAVRALEERLGVRLLARTTRSVAPTEAGTALLSQVAPALALLDDAAEAVNPHRLRPRGTVRLTLPQGAVTAVFAPKLSAFADTYPEVVLDLVVDDGFVEVVQEGLDAGIRLGESVTPGMTAVRVSQDRSAAVVASPTYWSQHDCPETPRDLSRHRCINRRFAAGRGVDRWRFARDGKGMEIACDGPLTVNSEVLIRRAALDGVGVAMLAEDDVADDLAAGRLTRVLEDWCPPLFGFFLYHPSHRLPSASLDVLVQSLKVYRRTAKG